MTAHPVEAMQPEQIDSIGITELAQASAMTRLELEELVEYGALQPLTSSPEPVFSLGWLQPLRTAGRLRRDYDLDLFVVVIVMDYLQRIDVLESQLLSLRARYGT